MKRFLRDSLIIILIAFLVFSITPYLIPISNYQFEDKKPFQESKYVDMGGQKIHYRDMLQVPEGKFPRGKVVFIHGFYGSTYSWNKTLEEVAKRGFYVVAIDLPGFGYSSKNSGINHSLDSRATLVWDVLSKLDSENSKIKDLPWNLVGHSMGGSVAAKIAETKENIGVLVLVDSDIKNQNSNIAKFFTWYPPVKRWISVFADYYYFEYNRIKDSLESAYGRRASDEEIKAYLEPIQEKGTSIAAADIVSNSNEGKVDLSKIKVATLIIWGENDKWIDKSKADEIKKDLQFSRLEILPGAGHIPQETHADEFNKALFNFIDIPTSISEVANK